MFVMLCYDTAHIRHQKLDGNSGNPHDVLAACRTIRALYRVVEWTATYPSAAHHTLHSTQTLTHLAYALTPTNYVQSCQAITSRCKPRNHIALLHWILTQRLFRTCTGSTPLLYIRTNKSLQLSRASLTSQWQHMTTDESIIPEAKCPMHRDTNSSHTPHCA